MFFVACYTDESIVTTHEELFREAADASGTPTPASKEVLRYREALAVGWDLVKQHRLLTANHIQRIQAVLEPSRAGFRKVPGTWSASHPRMPASSSSRCTASSRR